MEGRQFLLLLSPRRVIIRGEWTISGAAATPLSYASDTTRTLYTNDSPRRVLYDFVVLRATIVFPPTDR